MNLETHSFQQHTEVSWLSIGPAIKRILEQWEAICHFISELAKEPKKMPKSINFKRVYSMLDTKEKAVTVTQVLLGVLQQCDFSISGVLTSFPEVLTGCPHSV